MRSDEAYLRAAKANPRTFLGRAGSHSYEDIRQPSLDAHSTPSLGIIGENDALPPAGELSSSHGGDGSFWNRAFRRRSASGHQSSEDVSRSRTTDDVSSPRRSSDVVETHQIRVSQGFVPGLTREHLWLILDI